jgi:hypothetical protein
MKADQPSNAADTNPMEANLKDTAHPGRKIANVKFKKKKACVVVMLSDIWHFRFYAILSTGGFLAVEPLAVIAIFALLLSILMPSLSRVRNHVKLRTDVT